MDIVDKLMVFEACHANEDAAMADEAADEILRLRQQLAEKTSAEPFMWFDANGTQSVIGDLIDGKQISIAGATTKKPWGKFTAPLYTTPPSVEVLLEALRQITKQHHSAGLACSVIAKKALSSYKPTEG